MNEFEKSILEILSNPIPAPKYQLWQRMKQGQIVGYHYESVAYCFDGEGHSSRSYPGWCYHVAHGKNQSEIDEFHELDLTPLEE
jgi:hypothetical protein